MLPWIACIVLVLAAAPPAAAGAATPTVGSYGGQTAKGGAVTFRITDKGTRIRSLKLAYQASCTGGQPLTGTASFTSALRIRGSRFSASRSGRSVTGRFTSRTRAKGTLRVTLRGGACRTGTVSWTARRGAKPPSTTPTTPTTPTAPAQPLFTPPGRDLVGQEAFDSFKRYFLDSRFTNCPAGWPACTVEWRYNHCPDGRWQYFRLTSAPGADINSYGNYVISGAEQKADGSWGVEYHVFAYGAESFYHWEVAQDGTVRGYYEYPVGSGQREYYSLLWQQPANCDQPPY